MSARVHRHGGKVSVGHMAERILVWSIPVYVDWALRCEVPQWSEGRNPWIPCGTGVQAGIPSGRLRWCQKSQLLGTIRVCCEICRAQTYIARREGLLLGLRKPKSSSGRGGLRVLGAQNEKKQVIACLGGRGARHADTYKKGCIYVYTFLYPCE